MSGVSSSTALRRSNDLETQDISQLVRSGSCVLSGVWYIRFVSRDLLDTPTTVSVRSKVGHRQDLHMVYKNLQLRMIIRMDRTTIKTVLVDRRFFFQLV